MVNSISNKPNTENAYINNPSVDKLFTNFRNTSGAGDQPQVVAQIHRSTQAVGTVPNLPSTDVVLNLDNLSAIAAFPSPGAGLLSLMVKTSADQRTANKLAIHEQSKEIQENILKQADEMKKKAIAQLVTGLVSGSISIAQGVAGGISLGANMKAGAEVINAKQGSVNAFGAAGTSTVSAIGTFVSSKYEIAAKKLEASAEKFSNEKETLKAFNDSLSETIQKALSSMDNIQQNMNQTRAKILG